MSPRLATFLMFVVNGAVVGTWVAAIPSIKNDLSASGGEFGLALLFAPLGALVAQQVTGQLLVRVSSRRILTISALIFPWLVLLPLSAPTVPVLAVALFFVGYCNATMDLSMNAHGVVLEERGGVSIMSTLHAGWSLGGIFGALGIAAALALGVELLVEAFIAASVMWIVVLLSVPRLGTGSVRTQGASGFHLPSRAVLPLAGLIVLIAFVEGGLTDWGGVYLREGIGAGESLAAMAYAALSLGLFVGRIVGDRVKDAIGSVRLIQWGMFATAAALALTLLVEHPMVALAGMVAAGVGLANTVPQIFGAAGRIPPGGPSLSAVFTTLTMVFVVGPPLIGTTSDLVGIGGALWLFAIASLIVGLIAPRVPAAETNPKFRAQS